MIHIAVTEDVLALVIVSVTALIAWAWVAPVVIHQCTINVADFLVGCLAATCSLAAVVLAFVLAIQGGLS